ncbi:MAG: hypothetical protein AAF449_23930, partial [Myxococcota bacterium]
SIGASYVGRSVLRMSVDRCFVLAVVGGGWSASGRAAQPVPHRCERPFLRLNGAPVFLRFERPW